MKIYSDTLTQADLELAATECNSAHLGAHIGFETLEPLPYKPRVRRNGWEVLLYRIGSRRPFNSGLRGAAGEGAASWGDWGWFLSCLYEKDPEAKAGPYKSRGHFHASTQGAYRIAGVTS